MPKPITNSAGYWQPKSGIARTTALITLIVLSFVLAVTLAWHAATAVMTVAVGVLFAVMFDAGARALGHFVSWDRRLRLLIVFLLAAVSVIAAIGWGGTLLAAQAQNFTADMTQLLRKADAFIQGGRLGWLPRGTHLSALLPGGSIVFGGAATLTLTVIQLVLLAAAALILGAFFAWDPPVYKALVLSVLPRDRRARVNGALDLAADGMRAWLVGRSIIMALIFLFTLLALWVLGMPDPALLAVQAGLFTFIPTLGPFIGGIVIILAGLSQSPSLALYGVGTYVLIQFLESHLISPLVQEHTVHIPPAVIIGLQLLAATLLGVLAMAFIVPLAAAGKILIQELYVKDRLGGPWCDPARNSKPSRLHCRLQRILQRWR